MTTGPNNTKDLKDKAIRGDLYVMLASGRRAVLKQKSAHRWELYAFDGASPSTGLGLILGSVVAKRDDLVKQALNILGFDPQGRLHSQWAQEMKEGDINLIEWSFS